MPLLQVAAATAALTSTCAGAAEWSLTPSAETFARAQQNPRLVAGDEARKDVSGSLGARASAEILRRTERLALSLQPTVAAHRHLEDQDLDRDELHVDLSLRWQGERLDWLGNAGATRDSTLTSELGSTGLTQWNFRHESWDVAFGPVWRASERWTLRARLGTQAHLYPGRDETALIDYRYSFATTSADYLFSDRLLVGFTATAGRLSDEGPGPHSDDASFGIQARYSWSPLWTIGVGAGPSWIRSGEGRQQGVLYSADISRQFEKATLTLGASRRNAPSGRALVTDVQAVDLALNVQLSEKLSASLAAGVTRRRNALREIDLRLDEVQYSRAELRTAWRITPNWRLGASLGAASQQVGSLFVDDLTARGYDARLTLGWVGNPHVD